MPLIPPGVNWILFAPFFASGVSCAMVCTYLFHTMIAEVNSKSPEDRKIGVLFGHPGLFFQVMSLHRSYYPHSRLRFVLNAFIVLSLVCFLVVARAVHVL
jgi:amino acid permease